MVHKSDYVTANGVPIVNPANIVNGTISSKNIMYISKDKSIELERYKLEVNDIVLARRGDLTKCTIVGNEQVDFICGTGSFFLSWEFGISLGLFLGYGFWGNHRIVELQKFLPKIQTDHEYILSICIVLLVLTLVFYNYCVHPWYMKHRNR